MIKPKTHVVGSPMKGEGVVLSLAPPEDQGPEPELDPVWMVEELPRNWWHRLWGHGGLFAIPQSQLQEVP